MRRIHGTVLVGLLALWGIACSSFGTADPPAGSTTGEPDGGLVISPPDSDEVISLHIPQPDRLVQGQQGRIPITLVRSGTRKSDIIITMSGMPPGVAAEPLQIPAFADTGTLIVDVTTAVAQGPYTVTLEARAANASAYNHQDLSIFVRGPAGSLDPSFATNGGIAITDGSPSSLAPVDVWISDDDHIFVENRQYDPCKVARLEPNGMLDMTYGTNGITEFVSNVSTMMLLPDDRIIYGTYVRSSIPAGYGVILANGQIDGPYTPFNLPTGTTASRVQSITHAPDGSIFITFSATLQSSANVIGIAKLTSNGEIDTKFGIQASGITSAIFSGVDSFTTTGVAVRPDGNKIVIIGTYSVSAPADSGYGILQLNADGTPDKSFGKGGTPGQATFSNPSINDPSTSYITPSGLLLLPDGRFVSNLGASIAIFTVQGEIEAIFGENNGLPVYGSLDKQGRILVTSNTAYALGSISRFTANGKPDTLFGANGTATIPLPPNLLSGSSQIARVQSDGRIIVLSTSIPEAIREPTTFVSRLWD